MMATLGKVVLSSISSMLMSVISEDFFKWLFLFIAEKAVQHTSFKWDNELYEKIEKIVNK